MPCARKLPDNIILEMVPATEARLGRDFAVFKLQTGAQCLPLRRGALNMLLPKVNRRYRAYLEDGSYASHSVIAKWRAASLNSKVEVIRPCGCILF